jgi:hypothetical protein
MLSIFTLGAQRMAIDPALPRAAATPALTCASASIEEIPAMTIPPRAAPVVLRKSLLLDMPTTPFRIFNRGLAEGLGFQSPRSYSLLLAIQGLAAKIPPAGQAIQHR